MLRWPLKPKPVRKKLEVNPDTVAVTRVTCPSLIPRHVAKPRLVQVRRPAHTLGHLVDMRSHSRRPRRARKEEHPWSWGGGGGGCGCQLKGSVVGVWQAVGAPGIRCRGKTETLLHQAAGGRANTRSLDLGDTGSFRSPEPGPQPAWRHNHRGQGLRDPGPAESAGHGMNAAQLSGSASEKPLGT